MYALVRSHEKLTPATVGTSAVTGTVADTVPPEEMTPMLMVGVTGV